MEKYFLSKLDSDLNLNFKKAKLIEIQYSRKLPSFGLIYYTDRGHINNNKSSSAQINLATFDAISEGQDSTSRFKLIKRIKLDEAKIRSLTLFDSSSIINIEESNQRDAKKSKLAESNLQGLPDCVCLDDEAKFYAIWLSNEKIELLNLNLDSSSSSTTDYLVNIDKLINKKCWPIQIQYQKLLTEDEDSGNFSSTTGSEHYAYIHVLTPSLYVLYRISKSLKIDKLGSYWLESKSISFEQVLTIKPNPNLVALILNDSSLRLLSNLKLLTNIEHEQRNKKHTKRAYRLIHSNSIGQFLLISIEGLKLEASLVRLIESPSSGGNQLEHDPDKLLIKEPSFELERCWSLDLETLDSIRSLLEFNEDDNINNQIVDNTLISSNDNNYNIYLNVCPIWSYQDLNKQEEAKWPKFLIITFKYHLLIYSFEQQQQTSNPFKLLYDQSFYNLSESSSSSNHQSNQSLIDVSIKPKLVHNFRLVGQQASDSLFNTIFLVSQAQFQLLSHFDRFGLLIGLTSSAHLLALKFTSPKIVTQRDNVVRQLVCDSIRSDSLLRAQLNELDSQLCHLEEETSKLESQNSSTNLNESMLEETNHQLERMFKVHLSQRQDFGSLYELNISMSNIVQISRVLVILNVNSSFIMNPKDGDSIIERVTINNEPFNESGDSNPLLLANVRLDESQVCTNELPNKLDCSLSSWALIELATSKERTTTTMTTTTNQLSLPIFISDSQTGLLSVKLELKQNNFNNKQSDNMGLVSRARNINSQSERMSLTGRADLFSHSDEPEDGDQDLDWPSSPLTYLSSLIPIKPLMSYELASATTKSDDISKKPKLNPNSNINSVKVEIKGSFESDKMSAWLAECLRLPTSSVPTNARLVSLFSHSTLEFSIERSSLILVSDNILIIEIIKSHILKRATDESIRLETKQSDYDISKNLYHLIEAQYNNLIKVKELESRSSNYNYNLMSTRYENDNNDNLLIETLIAESEMGMEMGEQNSNHILEQNKIRSDIESDVTDLLYNSKQQNSNGIININQDHSPINTSSLGQVFLELVAGYLIDILADFQRLEAKRTSDQALISMRSRLLDKIFKHIQQRGESMGSDEFAQRVLSEWKIVTSI